MVNIERCKSGTYFYMGRIKISILEILTWTIVLIIFINVFLEAKSISDEEAERILSEAKEAECILNKIINSYNPMLPKEESNAIAQRAMLEYNENIKGKYQKISEWVMQDPKKESQRRYRVQYWQRIVQCN